MVKKRVKLNESALRNIIRKCVMEAVSEIHAIKPDEYDRLSNYDDDFGYDFIEGNEEPVCYDPSVRKDQMNADFENNRTPKPYNSKYYYDDFNLNTYDSNGDLGMKALKGNKFAKTLRRNTPRGWVDAAKDSKID